MIRVVLDTNVIVSAILKSDGAEAAVFLLALNRQVQLCISDAVLQEYEAVLSRAKFKRSPASVRQTIRSIKNCAAHVNPSRAVSDSPDPDDNRLLECAQASQAGYLVTGNKRYFRARGDQRAL